MRIIQSTTTFFKRVYSGAYQDPARDWLTLMTCATLALGAIIVWNAWAFDTVATGGVIGAPTEVKGPAFSRASLDTIHTIFSTRAEEQQKYVTGVYRFADPSQ